MHQTREKVCCHCLLHISVHQKQYYTGPKCDCILLWCLPKLHVWFHPIFHNIPNSGLYTAMWTEGLELHSRKMQFHYTICNEWEKFCFIAVDHITHPTLYLMQVQSVPITAGISYARVLSMPQYTDHSNISCSSRLIIFAIFLHLARMMSLFSFGRSVQRMFYLKSAHLSLRTAGLTLWHTTDFSIYFVGETNVNPN